ncbi:hypothetical protein C5B85_09020 [Pseudoclavibacter sp. AY1F1]|uniref:hypothetical protein n=1 Tax=Pseudoclavibacter sp. AY1F1 TaxID=2080583 RepID=UPI000CE8CB48|nr:hypothetical protein [Pseudoclavibacter sp. AY1F1]PPF44869.1 hypothetical protein C5B85_09020 [Pseudoclavibacter sp. AY1F1]
MSFWDAVTLIVGVAATLFGLWVIVTVLVVFVLDTYDDWKAARVKRIEAELDARAERMRATILSLADDLASERDDASRELTRAMFLATGRTPEPKA